MIILTRGIGGTGQWGDYQWTTYAEFGSDVTSLALGLSEVLLVSTCGGWVDCWCAANVLWMESSARIRWK